MKVGVSINFSKDEKLESSIFTEILSTDGDYAVYHMLKYLRNKNIQIEISGDWQSLKLAVDSTPILITGPQFIEFDTNFLSIDDVNCAAQCGFNLKINYKHEIFKDLWSLHMLEDSAKEQEGTIVGMVLQKGPDWLEIRGAGANTAMGQVSYPLNWDDFVDLKNLKFSDWIAGEKDEELIKIAKVEFESEKSLDERRSAHYRIINAISDLNLFLNALLQMVNQGLMMRIFCSPHSPGWLETPSHSPLPHRMSSFPARRKNRNCYRKTQCYVLKIVTSCNTCYSVFFEFIFSGVFLYKCTEKH
jgi:hypothetical protein